MTLDDKLVFDLPCWDDVSSNAKDLITKLLLKDPSKRISLDKAMEHPWFAGARTRYEQSQSQKTTGSATTVPLQQKKSSFATKTPYQQTAGALLD